MEPEDPSRRAHRPLLALLTALAQAGPFAAQDPGAAASDSRLAGIEQLLDELLRGAAQPEPLRWITASAGHAVRLIPVAEVLYFQADTKYTRVVTAEADALIRKPLRRLQAELDPAMFWPIHRSTIVNAHAISGVVRDDRGRVQVRLKQRGDRLAVSEAHTRRFRQM